MSTLGQGSHRLGRAAEVAVFHAVGLGCPGRLVPVGWTVVDDSKTKARKPFFLY